jgi:tubulin-specific chaperone E
MLLTLIWYPGESRSKIAASFVRPSRIADPVQSFVEAVHQKYASEAIEQQNAPESEKQIKISGKVVEEVGFDKIRRQLAQLRELKIVLVDGLRITSAKKQRESIREICPKIVELDLSRNLFESFMEIVKICQELDNLRSLRLKYVFKNKHYI